MATRGIIAVQRASGWRGRYVHWDNYPERMVGVIANLVARDGATQVVTTLINDNASWSVIDDTQTKANDHLGYGAENIIEGYGVIHSDMNPLDDLSWFTEESTDFAWAQYIYIIRNNGVDVLTVERQEDGTEIGVPSMFYPWTELVIN